VLDSLTLVKFSISGERQEDTIFESFPLDMTLEKVRLTLISSPQFTRKSKAFCFVHPDTHEIMTRDEEKEQKLKLVFWMEEGPKIFIKFLDDKVSIIYFFYIFDLLYLYFPPKQGIRHHHRCGTR